MSATTFSSSSTSFHHSSLKISDHCLGSDLALSDYQAASEKPKRKLLSRNDQESLNQITSMVRSCIFPKGLELKKQAGKDRTFILKNSNEWTRSEIKNLLSDIQVRQWYVKVSRKPDAHQNHRIRLQYDGILMHIVREMPPQDQTEPFPSTNAHFMRRLPNGQILHFG